MSHQGGQDHQQDRGDQDQGHDELDLRRRARRLLLDPSPGLPAKRRRLLVELLGERRAVAPRALERRRQGPKLGAGHAFANRGDRLALRHPALDLGHRDRQLSQPVARSRRSRSRRGPLPGCARPRFRPPAGPGRRGAPRRSAPGGAAPPSPGSASGATKPAAGRARASRTASRVGSAGEATAASRAPDHDPARLSGQHGCHRDPLRQAGAPKALRDAKPQRGAGQRPHPPAAQGSRDASHRATELLPLLPASSQRAAAPSRTAAATSAALIRPRSGSDAESKRSRQPGRPPPRPAERPRSRSRAGRPRNRARSARRTAPLRPALRRPAGR